MTTLAVPYLSAMAPANGCAGKRQGEEAEAGPDAVGYGGNDAPADDQRKKRHGN
jgi:hypothetical protein